MKRITIHWTCGTYTPNSCDLLHYHFLIDGNGNIINGKYTPEDNINCKDGKYAAHTGGGNTNNIGVALCGMHGYEVNKAIRKLGSYPLRKLQFDSLYILVANICKKYDIAVNEDNVLTHYEFGLKHPNTTSKGKIDINFIPHMPNLQAKEVGNYIRENIRKHLRMEI